MRGRLSGAVAVAMTCLFVGARFLQGQSVPSGITVICPSLYELQEQYDHEDHQQPAGPKIVLADIVFSGATRVTVSEQREIAAAIERQTTGYSLDAVTDEALERTRAAWQDRGYFNAKVTGDASIVRRRPSPQAISVHVHVDEGIQYRLGEITFKNNRAISDVAHLRRIFPTKDGDIFSREKIAQGLENLRETYGQLGYLYFTAVPETMVDDEAGLISLVIDIDEGKQLYFSTIQIIGLDERTRQEVLKDAPIGQIYSRRLLGQFLRRHSAVFKLQPDDPRLTAMRFDQETGAVSITLYACPCPVC